VKFKIHAGVPEGHDEAEFLNNSSSPKAKVCKSLVPRNEKTRVYTAENTNGNADKGSNEDAQNGFVAHGTSLKEMKLRLLGHLEGLLRILLSKILLGCYDGECSGVHFHQF